jgi:hypothetical protein
MTPREYQRAMESATERIQIDAQREMTLAWQTAAFVAAAYVGKLPPLERVLQRMEMARLTAAPKHTGAVVAAWSEFMGIKARPLSEAAKQALAKQHG